MKTGAESKLKVAILDDHQSTLDGYSLRLGQSPQFEIVGVAVFGAELEPVLAASPVNVLLLDVHVPTAPDNPNPYPILHTIPHLLERYPGLVILVVSMIRDRSLIRAVMDAGASGYILKNDRAAIQALGSIVRSVAGGEIYLSEEVRRELQRRADKIDAGNGLSPRQSQALSLCAAHPEWTHIDLAAHLSVAPSTARNTLHSAYLRLGVNNLASAIAKAQRLGLITPLEPT